MAINLITAMCHDSGSNAKDVLAVQIPYVAGFYKSGSIYGVGIRVTIRAAN